VLLNATGTLAIALALFVLAMLSRRLGRVTHAKPTYIYMHISAVFIALSAIIKIANGLRDQPINDAAIWVLVYNVVPAIGITISLMVAWRYWSWLFAERD
jgi:hypothetical protein